MGSARPSTSQEPSAFPTPVAQASLRRPFADLAPAMMGVFVGAFSLAERCAFATRGVFLLVTTGAHSTRMMSKPRCFSIRSRRALMTPAS